jgi:hypothetical protein
MLTGDGKGILTNNQLAYLYNAVDNIIERLPEGALNQLLEGYGNDVDTMLREMVHQSEKALYLGRTLDSESLSYVDNVKASMDNTLKILSLNYFITTMLPKFRLGWRNIEWSNLTQLYPWSCYLCARASGKCMSANTLVVMYDGSLKKIQDIKVGDKVMGVDSTPRTVLQLHKGVAPMYRIEQTYSIPYEVNEGHLVCTKVMYKKRVKGAKPYISYTESIYEDIPVEQIPNHAGYSQKKILGYRVKGWELLEQNLPIEPYFLGIWLGDGYSNNGCISKPDIEIFEYLKGYAERLGGYLRSSKEGEYRNKNMMKIIRKSNDRWKERDVLKPMLEELNLIHNKHIPDIYMRSSKKQRLELLAGILDTDGCYNKGSSRSFEYSTINKTLAYQVQKLAWSLGFRCKTIREEHKNIKIKNKKKGDYVLEDYVFYRMNISGNAHLIPTKIKRKQIPNVKVQQDTQVSSLTVTPIGEGEYYGFACDGDHKFLLEDGTVVHNSFQWSYAFILWRLWSYTRPTAYRQDTTDNANRKETCYITNTFTLAKVQIAKVTEEIEANDLIKEKLNPYNKASIGETAIKTETGSTLHVRGKDSMIRGLHVGACLCDDMPDESSLYSDEQREKLKELLKGTIEPIVEPYGYFLVTGTPYSSAPNELYQVLKADKRFYCFEYPILFPDGRPLAPDRYTFEQILDKKEELGTIVFNREYLVVPISDTSTIFPYEYLMRSIIGMETIRFASSIDDFPFKLTRVHIGVDFAVSGNIGADYTVYSVWGKDAMDNYYLLYYYRKRGMSHNEQVDKIVQLDRLFHPNKIRCEANGFQSILSGLAKERGLKNIEPFTTTEGNKKDLYTGLPSLSAMFERGQIKCPYAMGETRQAVDLMFGEFSSITFRSDNGKLEAASGHDDVVMANFLAINSLREDDKEVQVSVALI